VLGTFAMYHPSAHTPEPADITLIEQSAQLASIAIEKNMAADRLRESEAHFRLLTEQVSDVIWRQDQHNVFTYISPADERLRGYRADEVIGQHVSTLLTEEGIATLANVNQRRLNAEQQGTPATALTFELQQRCKDGRLIWTEVLSTPERDVQGKIIGYHGVTREITERKQMQDQVRQLAFFDPLTHLPNRRMLDDRLTQAMATSARTGRYGALMFLDLDNFKPLNDTHGHEAGDYLLVEVARRLKTCVREVDTVVRIGGDEFVVMLSELSIDQTESSLQAGAVAEKIRLALAQPYVLTVRHAGQADKTVEHHCSASLGVALFVNHHTSQVDILKWADAAMYQAKDAGRNRVRFFGNKNTPLAGL
jgi:diguanylate cyclase (GGDEF)-like protein/PAS domain S-box-containing protein